MLAILADRPREVVPRKELCEAAFVPSHDLHWRVWKLRKLVGDDARQHKIIGNRRGVGYVLDLPPKSVRVVQGVALQGDEPSLSTAEEHDPATQQGAPTEEQSAAVAETGTALPALPEDPGRSESKRRRASGFVLRPATAFAAILIVSITLGGSWLAGYRLSQRDSPAATGGGPRETPEVTPSAATGEEPAGKQKRRDSEGRTGHSEQTRGDDGNSRDEVAGTVITAPSSQGDKPSDVSRSSGGASKPKPPPPPPQPDAQLLHLHHPDSGERYMTISSGAANQKQAAGYDLSAEGRVFTTQVKGTVAISLDDGSAFIYPNRDAVPSGVSVTELYRLTRDGDFFYSKSSGTANQAEAQGWSRSVVGVVQ